MSPPYLILSLAMAGLGVSASHGDRQMSSGATGLPATWPHNRVAGATPQGKTSCDVECNAEEHAIDVEADFWPRGECLGRFQSVCSFDLGKTTIKTTTKCNGVFMYAKHAPRPSHGDDDSNTDARAAAEAALADMPVTAEPHDWSGRNITFASCEGELMATSMVIHEDPGVEGPQASASRRLQKHRHHNGGNPGNYLAISVCSGLARSVTAGGPDSDHEAASKDILTAFTCDHDYVSARVVGLPDSHPGDHDLEHLISKIEARAREEVQHGAVGPPPPLGDATSLVDHGTLLALHEEVDGEDAPPTCEGNTEHQPDCDVKCNGHEGLRFFGLWPCTGEFDFTCSTSGRFGPDKCFKDKVDIRCLGHTWPWWNQCDGTILLNEDAHVTGKQDKVAVHSKSFLVGVGKTHLIDYHHGHLKATGVVAHGHTSVHVDIHMHTSVRKPKGAAVQAQLVDAQLVTLE